MNKIISFCLFYNYNYLLKYFLFIDKTKKRLEKQDLAYSHKFLYYINASLIHLT